jgi:hypothetical protein
MRRAYAVKMYIEINDDDYAAGCVVTDDAVEIANRMIRFAEEDHPGHIDLRLAEVKPVPISAGPDGGPV